MGIFHTDISTKPVIAQVQVVERLYCSLSQVLGIKLEKRNLVLVEDCMVHQSHPKACFHHLAGY